METCSGHIFMVSSQGGGLYRSVWETFNGKGKTGEGGLGEEEQRSYDEPSFGRDLSLRKELFARRTIQISATKDEVNWKCVQE